MLQKLVLDWLFQGWEYSSDPLMDAHDIATKINESDNQELISELNTLFQAWISNDNNVREMALSNIARNINNAKSESLGFAKNYIKSQKIY